jgi:crotonobetainyl-CoA:carnitine CoA-transferase CaiB-like acyl-CoA transferase
MLVQSEITLSRTTPADHARRLLDGLGLHALMPAPDRRSAAQLWAQSGAMWLSGHADAPPRACPAPLAACAQGAWLALAALAPTRLADDFSDDFEAFHLLGERAAIAGLSRQGRRSAGGACELLDTADGVLALNLARAEDAELLPAWLQRESVAPEALPELLRGESTAWLVERARLLGLAAAPMVSPQPAANWFRTNRLAAPHMPQHDQPLVIDLSALWAGPLCGQLLMRCGARVIKVESTARPDGARNGPPHFFDLMNGGKESVALDLRSAGGRALLAALLAQADIVIESARPRALAQLGIDAERVIASRPGMVWLGITGYGRRAPMGDWIAYGDDAGVAAGLSWLMGGDRGDPVFCGDAIADPLTGLHAALLAWAAWCAGGGVLLDVALRDVAAFCSNFANSTAEVESDRVPEPPRARRATGKAAVLGADTARVLREFGLEVSGA